MSATTTVSRLFALGRTTYGSGLVGMPELFARPWIGREARRPAVQLALRALGVRDAALGVGALLTSNDPARQRIWLAAGAISDLVDMAATLATPAGKIPQASREGVAVFAAASAVTGAVLYGSLSRRASRPVDVDPEPIAQAA